MQREREREGERELYSWFQLDPIPSRMSSIPGIHWRFAGKFPRSRLIQIYAHLKQYIPRAKWLPVTRECWRPLAATCGHLRPLEWLQVAAPSKIKLRASCVLNVSLVIIVPNFGLLVNPTRNIGWLSSSSAKKWERKKGSEGPHRNTSLSTTLTCHPSHLSGLHGGAITGSSVPCCRDALNPKAHNLKP